MSIEVNKKEDTMIDQLDELENQLNKIKTAVMSLNIRSAKLNIDLVSVHDPGQEKKLMEDTKICNDCSKKCHQRTNDETIFENDKQSMKINLVVKNKEE